MKWEDLRNISLPSSQNGMGSSQHGRSTQDESCYALLPVAQIANRHTICTKSVQCCVIVCSDTSWRTTAKISLEWHKNWSFFVRKDVCWSLSQEILGMLNGTDAKYHAMMYGYHCYSQYSDSEKSDLPLFKSNTRTNLDIIDAACLFVVHISQQPTSRPSTKLTQNTKVNSTTKDLLALLAGQYGKLTKHSTRRRHQTNQAKSALEEEWVRALGALRSLRCEKKVVAGNWRETHFSSNEVKEKWIED